MLSKETRSSSQPDWLAPLLNRYSFRANVFFSGAMCGREEYDAKLNHSYLHLVRRGPVKMYAGRAEPISIDQPSLILLAKPLGHVIEADDQAGADMVCARLSFDGAGMSPLLLGN